MYNIADFMVIKLPISTNIRKNSYLQYALMESLQAVMALNYEMEEY